MPLDLRPALGNYAHGEGFWDRALEVAEISGYLDVGQGILLTGPRRVGKTSVVHKVLEGMAPATRTLFVDVEGHASPIEMFAGIGAAASADGGFWRRIRPWFAKRLGSAFDRVESIDVKVIKVELQSAGTRSGSAALTTETRSPPATASPSSPE